MRNKENNKRSGKQTNSHKLVDEQCLRHQQSICQASRESSEKAPILVSQIVHSLLSRRVCCREIFKSKRWK